jgi:CheY-like chemotaxis protein
MPLIVILEDEETLVSVLREVFRPLGIDVVGYENKADFLRHPEHASPDLIITDVAAPEMDGLEFLRFRAEIPGLARVPVIVVSGRTEPPTIAAAMAAGAEAFIGKPFETEVLVKTVRRLLRAR